MPSLKLQPNNKARDAVKRVYEDMRFMSFSNSDLPKSDYFLGLLWVEGYKVVPLDGTE